MSDFSRLPARPSLEQLHKQAKELLRNSANSEMKLANAQFAIARKYGFESWARLKHHIESLSMARLPVDPRAFPHGMSSTPPFYRVDWQENYLTPQALPSDKDWDTIFAVMQEHGITGLRANGYMSDAALERLSKTTQVARLNLGGSLGLTDDGLAHLGRLPSLQELDLSGWKGRITDRGLETLRHLPELRRFALCWQQNVSDVGLANLAFCEHLEKVDLLGTPAGDEAIRALTGKRRLREFKTGYGVTDAGLGLLHEFPLLKTWHDGEIRYGLMVADAGPTHLLLDGPFTDAGLAKLAGLDGLFALSFFWHSSNFSAAGLRILKDLSKLGFLGCGEERCTDEALRHIGALPGLRMLMAQGAVAGDIGFEALSRSASLEYLWGRACPNLTGRGFTALAAMPCLRGLALSCKNVDDAALSALPRFPALRELMPMDLLDGGFRHIGKCAGLEALWCMYCRETGDAATAHIAGLTALKSYYAGKTQITDRSLEILAGMPSLERLEFWQCAGVTNLGVARLASLPGLRELSLQGMPGITREAMASFPAGVRVNYST